MGIGALKIQEEDLEKVAGGIPGQLICETAASVVNTIFNTGNAESGNSGSASRPESSHRK